MCKSYVIKKLFKINPLIYIIFNQIASTIGNHSMCLPFIVENLSNW